MTMARLSAFPVVAVEIQELGREGSREGRGEEMSDRFK
jgi:hypothetical protein